MDEQLIYSGTTDNFYLDDIHLLMTRIEEYIGNLEFVAFKQNWMVVDAVPIHPMT